MNSCNAFIGYIIVLGIILVILSYMYRFVSRNTDKENFENYLDTKTKTLNWCDKMHKSGLLSDDQLNQCLASFRDVSSGLTTSKMEIPKTGLDRNYSLYDTKNEILEPNISGNNSLTIMLITYDGLTMACKPDGTLYFVPNINDSKINQKELYFTLVPQNENVYGILSPYGKFLLTDQNYNASFTGSTIGILSSWNITKIDTNTNLFGNSGQVKIQSVQFPGFVLIYDDTIENIKLEYGNSESGLWSMISRNETLNTENNNIIGAEYFVSKENILKIIKENYSRKIILEITIDILQKVKDKTNDNYINILNYIEDSLNRASRIYELSQRDYQTRLNSINENSMLSEEARNNLITSLQRPSGFNITNNTINIVLNRIRNAKNTATTQIQNKITQLQNDLNKISITELNNQYTNYIQTLKNELDDTQNRILQNNIVMSRQKSLFNKMSTEINYNSNKMQKIKNVDNISSANINILNNFSNQNSLLMKIYPAVILIMTIILIYLIYSTYNKFIDNIYNKY